MTCPNARERFSGLLDDALPAAERRAVVAHLTGCSDCRADLARLRATVALLHRVEPPRAPARFVDRVLEAARAASWRRRLLRRLVVPLRVRLPLEAAALVLVAVAALYVVRETPELRQAARLEPPPVARPQPAEPPRPAEERERARGRAAEPKDAERDRARSGATIPAPAAQSKTETPAAPAERQLDAARESAASAPPESRADALKSQGAPAAPPRVAAKRDVGGVVAGRLAVADREAADRALADLVARLGGTLSRRAETDATLIEVTIPRAAYPELVRELGRLGRWRAEREPAELPESVTVTFRLTD